MSLFCLLPLKVIVELSKPYTLAPHFRTHRPFREMTRVGVKNEVLDNDKGQLVRAYAIFILLVRSVRVFLFLLPVFRWYKHWRKKLEGESYAGIRRGRNITSRSNFREFRDPQKVNNEVT